MGARVPREASVARRISDADLYPERSERERLNERIRALAFLEGERACKTSADSFAVHFVTYESLYATLARRLRAAGWKKFQLMRSTTRTPYFDLYMQANARAALAVCPRTQERLGGEVPFLPAVMCVMRRSSARGEYAMECVPEGLVLLDERGLRRAVLPVVRFD